MKCKFEIAENKRRMLADHLKQSMYREDINISQLAVETGINLSDLHSILAGTKKKINPTHMRLLAKALRLEAMNLYYIVGYIDEKEWDNYRAEKKGKVLQYPAQRNLDGIFFRVLRNGKYTNVSFTDLVDEEKIEILDGITDTSMRNMVLLLSASVRELGDRFNLVRVTDDVKG